TVPTAPGYQVPFASAVKRGTDMATAAVGLITEPRQAESVLAEGHADYVAIARAFLFDPRWAWHAAIELGADAYYPPQYERCHPRSWPPAAALARRLQQ